jgi:outer membrane lipoprotein-sorting protein
MRSGIQLALLFALVPMAGCIAHSQAKPTVLDRLDAASAKFHSTSADVEFDDITTDPVYDKDVQTGQVYYERKGSSFKTGAHFTQHNGKPIIQPSGKPAAKVYTYTDGILRIFEPALDEVTTVAKAKQWEKLVMLGFGASGKELADQWTIKDLGPEKMGGVNTEKLELVAKDPEVRKHLTKVTVWIDPDRAVSLKQVLDFSASNSRVSTYSNIKVNESLPSDAFTIKTDKKTQYRTQ